MINLLPPDSVKQLRAARHNSILIRYVIGGAIVLGLIVLVYGAAFVLFKSTEAISASSSKENQTKVEEYSAVAASAKEYSANLKRARTILDSELSYATALENVAKSLPAGTIITTLSLSSTSTSQPITMTIQAKSQQAALDVKGHLEKNKIAKDISISSLTKESTSGEPGAVSADYPYSINLNLTLLDTIFKSPEEESDA